MSCIVRMQHAVRHVQHYNYNRRSTTRCLQRPRGGGADRGQCWKHSVTGSCQRKVVPWKTCKISHRKRDTRACEFRFEASSPKGRILQALIQFDRPQTSNSLPAVIFPRFRS